MSQRSHTHADTQYHQITWALICVLVQSTHTGPCLLQHGLQCSVLLLQFTNCIFCLNENQHGVLMRTRTSCLYARTHSDILPCLVSIPLLRLFVTPVQYSFHCGWERWGTNLLSLSPDHLQFILQDRLSLLDHVQFILQDKLSFLHLSAFVSTIWIHSKVALLGTTVRTLQSIRH